MLYYKTSKSDSIYISALTDVTKMLAVVGHRVIACGAVVIFPPDTLYTVFYKDRRMNRFHNGNGWGRARTIYFQIGGSPG